METEVPRRKEEKSVVKKEQATEVGLPSTINKAAATGSNDKGIEPVATEIPEESKPLGAFLVEVPKLLVLIKKNPDVDHYIYGEIYVPTRYRNVMLFKRGIENPQKVGSYVSHSTLTMFVNLDEFSFNDENNCIHVYNT